MIVREIHAANYRSLRSIRFPTRRLTVFVGANGVGKTNLYRALQLLQASAAGTLARELAAEGGMQSASWAGKRYVGESPRIKLSAGFGEPALEGVLYAYEVEIGVPPPLGRGAFPLEPDVKEEQLLFHHRGRKHKLLERRGGSVMARDADGKRTEISRDLLPSETALGASRRPAELSPTCMPSGSSCSTGASIMTCGPTRTRRCDARASPWRHRPWHPMAPISPRCWRR